jgi:hypothetical protein
MTKRARASPEQLLAAWQTLEPEQKALFRRAHGVLGHFKRLLWRREMQRAIDKEWRAVDAHRGAALRAIEQVIQRALDRTTPTPPGGTAPAPKQKLKKIWFDEAMARLPRKKKGESIKAYSRRLFAEPDNPFDTAESIETRIHEKLRDERNAMKKATK